MEVAESESRGREVLVRWSALEPKADWIKAMWAILDSEAGRARYGLRRQTVEPVFGIVKEAMGSRRFLLRGLENVDGEWAWVTLASNCKRLKNMILA